ncbi:MAG: isomerase [Planctomycetaceae bacterium]|nr:isomerase [Planctomycetaceae bacterium]
MKPAFIHPQAICECDHVGSGTRIWAFAHVLPKAKIGADCNICDHVFIENDVVLGDRVTVKCGVQLWDGLRVEDDVFLGPNVTLSNDKYPRSKQYQAEVLQTVIEEGASVGANSTILPGIRIGKQAVVGAGSVVTRSVPAGAVVMGNPARIAGYVDSENDQQFIPTPSADVHSHLDEGSGEILGEARWIALGTHRDLRGALAVTEFAELPFNPTRCFVVYDVPSKHIRGEHAHKQCQQVLVCVHGSVSVILDDGRHRRGALLDSPSHGIYLPAMMWATQYAHSPDAVVLCYASHPYDPSDYIRDYGEFLEQVGPTVEQGLSGQEPDLS